MSTLQIRKLESGVFKHVDSIDGEFFLGVFNFKVEFNKAFLVEAYGAKRREYDVLQISVFDYLGTAELFTNFTDLENRLTELGYTGIQTNGIIPTASSYISSDADNALQLGADNKLFVPESAGDFLSNDSTTYSPATLPLTGTELALVEQGGTFKKVKVNDLASNKLDKVTTADVDKVYIKKADGTQGMKALSELGGSLRTFICIFGINQNLAPTPIGNTQWFARGVQSGNNLTGTFTLVPGLDVTTSFSTHTVLSPCFSLPFQAKIKSVFIRGWHSGSNNLGVDFAIVKSKESGPTINGGITTVSNPLIVARENVQIWAPGAGNGFLKQFNIGSLNLSTLPLGSDIRLVFKNQNIPSAMWDTLVTVEFEEVI